VANRSTLVTPFITLGRTGADPLLHGHPGTESRDVAVGGLGGAVLESARALQDEGSWTVTSSQGDPFATGDDDCSMIMDQNNAPVGYAVPAHTPGGQNPTQSLTCGIIPQICGDDAVQYGEDCGGDVCFECACGEAPMGLMSFTVAPGPSAMDRCDSADSILSTHGGPTGGMAGLVCNGSQGDFTAGPIVLFGGRPDADGIASLRVDGPVVIKTHLDTQKPGCGGECVA